MNVSAVICEYNPMHEGHRRMLRNIRECSNFETTILCLMSGDFVQRGEPAVFDKYRRAEEAVRNGADLVLELPYPWSSSVAEHFAFGALSILQGLGRIDKLFFGSENRNAEELKKIGMRLASAEFGEKRAIARKNDRKSSFPRLNDHCYEELYGEKLSLSSNETLGMYYVSEIMKRKSEIIPFALPLFEGFSASVKRKELRESGCDFCAFLENGEKTILTLLSLSNGNSRFVKAAGRCNSLTELWRKVRTPADTDARLRRELLSVLLSNTGKEERLSPKFTVLLAADKRGREYLSAVRKSAAVEVVTKKADAPRSPEAAVQYAFYLKAQSFYTAFLKESVNAGFLMDKHPFILD